MLILSRSAGECIVIGDEVTVTVLEVRDKRVRLGIKAPRDVRVDRQEIRERINRGEPAKKRT